MNATKKLSITAILITACVVLVLLAATRSAPASASPAENTETESPAEAIPVTVITTTEPSDVPAKPVASEDLSDPEPVIEQKATSVIDYVSEIEKAPEPTNCSYCSSAEHNSTYCAKKAIEQRGAYARWRVPSVGLDVAVFYVDSLAPVSTKQAITDAADSATYYYMNNTVVIGDHNYQGFNAIKGCNVGSTAYLDMGDMTLEFVCTENGIGSNRVEPMDTAKGYGRCLRYPDGELVELAFRGGLICYTCNENSDNVTIVSFQPTY